MSGSNEGYQEIDLDNLGKPANGGATTSDIEIIDETQAPQDIEVVQETTPAPVPTPTVAVDSDPDEDESGADPTTGERKRTTRSQRLKNQRDAYAQQLAAVQAELQAEREARRRFEADANEGAAIGFDLYAKQLDTAMQALRRDFDQAFDAGDREKIFDVQQKMAQLTAERTQIERERRAIPTKPVQKSGPEVQPQIPATPPQQVKRQPSPAAIEWYERNKNWFNKDVVMTAGARVIDNQMVRDGYAPEDPDYFEELDRRLQQEFPHKLGKRLATQRPTASPTIQNRSTPAAAPGKIRVTITQADRDMANQFGITVEEYARQKARIEASQRTATQYTEIL